MAKRAEVYYNKEVIEKLGLVLRDKRVEQGFSHDDVVEMTSFPKSTIINLEQGVATNINYYIAYGQAIKLNIFKSNIALDLVPRFELSPGRKNRKFLTLKVRNLFKKEDFFLTQKSVDDVVKKLSEQYKYQISRELSTSVSGILLNLVEDGLLQIVQKQGRNNIYIKVNL